MIALDDLVISKETLDSANISKQDLLLEIAIYLYENERFTISQARHLAKLDQISFQKELAKRNVFIRFDETDLLTDIKNLGIEI